MSFNFGKLKLAINQAIKSLIKKLFYNKLQPYGYKKFFI